MKRKGFTLIELLAVIVILAIIALIAIPIVMNTIENSRKSAAEISAANYIKAVENAIAASWLEGISLSDGVYQIMDNGNICSNKTKVCGVGDKEIEIEVNGIKLTSGSIIQLENDLVKKTGTSLEIDSYTVTYNNEENPVFTKPGLGPTMVDVASNETHKGIIYLDPTNLRKTCTEQNYNSNSSVGETKIGCMKWYIFNDTGNEYTMILDHNTTARITWNDSNQNVTYENSNLKSVVDDLITTSKWVVTPRLITAAEVNTITGKENFNSANYNSWYYLDNKTRTKSTFLGTNSTYDWLYNNSQNCATSGCSIEDNNYYPRIEADASEQNKTSGYWTSTTVGNAGSGSYVWYVEYTGRLDYGSTNNILRGVRPVITISKSEIS